MLLSSQSVFIDATLFMGMHSSNEHIRRQSLAVMSGFFGGLVHMSLEQVGLCDDIVWSYPRQVQDGYYPFMDCLHSQMDIRRISYSLEDMKLAATYLEDASNDLSVSQALVVAQVANASGILFTHDAYVARKAERLAVLGEAPTGGPLKLPKPSDAVPDEGLFSSELDFLYWQSTCLVYQ